MLYVEFLSSYNLVLKQEDIAQGKNISKLIPL